MLVWKLTERPVLLAFLDLEVRGTLLVRSYSVSAAPPDLGKAILE